MKVGNRISADLVNLFYFCMISHEKNLVRLFLIFLKLEKTWNLSSEDSRASYRRVMLVSCDLSRLEFARNTQSGLQVLTRIFQVVHLFPLEIDKIIPPGFHKFGSQLDLNVFVVL